MHHFDCQREVQGFTYRCTVTLSVSVIFLTVVGGGKRLLSLILCVMLSGLKAAVSVCHVVRSQGCCVCVSCCQVSRLLCLCVMLSGLKAAVSVCHVVRSQGCCVCVLCCQVSRLLCLCVMLSGLKAAVSKQSRKQTTNCIQQCQQSGIFVWPRTCQTLTDSCVSLETQHRKSVGGQTSPGAWRELEITHQSATPSPNSVQTPPPSLPCGKLEQLKQAAIKPPVCSLAAGTLRRVVEFLKSRWWALIGSTSLGLDRMKNLDI
ncbi:hypothetical protein BgiMline_030962 [Biomphalaria glabrata]